jgi:DNA repair exonuclease SbcCD nuclease subunit
MLNFFLSEVRRLEKIPVVMIPGARDYYQKGTFWEEWDVLRPAENLHLLISTESPYIQFPALSTTIYGYPIMAETSLANPVAKIKKFGKSEFHIAVIYGNLVHDTTQTGHSYPFHAEDLNKGGFDYCALGGQRSFHDFSSVGVKAAYSGSPEMLMAEHNGSGRVLVVNAEKGKVSVEPRKIGSFVWREARISMEAVANIDDLKQKILKMSGPDVLLKVTLQGLALLEAGLDIEQLHRELDDQFLHLEFIDRSEVLPHNISEVKVQEKTILGQYLKVMVDKLNRAEGTYRTDLEASLKIGYTLLTGKEIW